MTPSNRKPLKPRHPCLIGNNDYFITSNSKPEYDKILQVVNKNVSKGNVKTVKNEVNTVMGDDRWSRLGARPKLRSRTLETIHESTTEE